MQYPFAVNEKVVIKVSYVTVLITKTCIALVVLVKMEEVLNSCDVQGNRRTPDKFVGKEAIITSQCLNGW